MGSVSFDDLLPGAQTRAPVSFDDLTPQYQGVMREPLLGGSSALKGFGSFLDMLAAPSEDQTVTDLLSGVPKWRSQTPITGALQRGGLIDRPDLQPQTGGERAWAAAAHGAGSALRFLPLGVIGAIAPVLASGAGSGVGSYYGGELGGVYGHPVLGSILGSIAGGGIGGAVGSGVTKGGNALLGNYGEAGQAYQDANVPLNFTGNNGVTAYSSKSLGGSGRTQSLIHQESDAFGNSAENTAAGLGTSTSLQELGDKAQSAGQQWLQNFKNASAQAHNAVTQAVGADAPVAPTATQTVLDDIKSSAGGSPEAETFLKSGLAKDIGGIVSNAPGGVLPWQTARAIRSRIGEYLENPQLIADAGTAQAKRLYGALTDDLQTTVANSPNPNAQQLFNLANQYTATGHDFIDNVLSPIMSKDAPSAARWILNSGKGGDQILGPLRQNMPQAADEAAAYKLRDMALAPNGSQNAAGTQVSPGSFLTDWNALAPEAKAALYPDPATSNRVNALAQIAGDVKARQALVNHSNTAHSNAVGGMILAAGEGARTGYEAGGLGGALAGAGMGGAVLPMSNYLYSLLGANRPLARLLAAQGPWALPAATGIGSSLLTSPHVSIGTPSLLGYSPSP